MPNSNLFSQTSPSFLQASLRLHLLDVLLLRRRDLVRHPLHCDHGDLQPGSEVDLHRPLPLHHEQHRWQPSGDRGPHRQGHRLQGGCLRGVARLCGSLGNPLLPGIDPIVETEKKMTRSSVKRTQFRLNF